MAIKTFNLEENTYNKFAEFCREHGLSMSKQVDIFIKSQIETKPQIREEYLKRLDAIRKGKFIRFKSMEDFDRHIKSKNA